MRERVAVVRPLKTSTVFVAPFEIAFLLCFFGCVAGAAGVWRLAFADGLPIKAMF